MRRGIRATWDMNPRTRIKQSKKNKNYKRDKSKINTQEIPFYGDDDHAL